MARRRYFEMPAIDQPDPEPGFQHSSDEFIIPTVDEEGLSDRCQFRAPSSLLAWAEQIIDSRQFPFRRAGDLMRYGLYLACVQLCRIEKDVPSMQAKIDAANAILQRRANAARVTEHLDAVTEVIHDLQKRKAWGEIAYVLDGEHRMATEMLDSESYWAQCWLQGLTERFADIRALAESKLDFVDLNPKNSRPRAGGQQ